MVQWEESPGRERRTAVRYGCDLRSRVRPDGADDGAAKWWGRIRDVSAGGLGLLVQNDFAVGTILAVEPLGRGADRLFRARVVRSARQAGCWLCGCELLQQITDTELHALT
jgi:hypothetical protein